MQLEKELNKKTDEPMNIYEELFSKKNTHIDAQPEQNTSPEKKELIPDIKEKPSIGKKEILFDKLKTKIRKLNMKYLVTGLLVGIIVNISVSHYQSMELQINSQKLATGLIYNLSETNNLQEIARNIYTGMKENGWEPTIKLSNDNIFVFELKEGGEFTITKYVDVVSTKYHISVEKFSREMVTALKIQLEPSKIGGTKNYITNKKYNPSTNAITFDIEKIGSGSVDLTPLALPIPTLPPLPPLPIQYQKNNTNIDSPIIKIPISPVLENKINQKEDDKNDKIIEKNKVINKSETV